MSADLSRVLSLYEFERLAKPAMPEMAWEYVSAGVADEITLHANRKALDRLAILPRLFVDVSKLDTSAELFGRRHEFPILLAPCAFQKLVHPEGELESVRGANLSGATLVAATFGTVTLEETAHASARPLWFQLYVQPDRGFTRELVQRAEAAGCEALMVTVDVPVNGPRERELRAGFALPPGVIRANLESRGLAFASAPHRPSGRNIYSAVRAPDVTPKDLAWLRSLTRLPVVVKGVLHPADAEIALDCGADGVCVSNHGGRSMDTVPASLDMLPGVVERVGGRVPVLFDGGIRRGTDVLKAAALGASAVLIGRPYLYGLAVGGAAGVARVVEILRTELEMAMGFAGVTRIGHAAVSCVVTSALT